MAAEERASVFRWMSKRLQTLRLHGSPPQRSAAVEDVESQEGQRVMANTSHEHGTPSESAVGCSSPGAVYYSPASNESSSSVFDEYIERIQRLEDEGNSSNSSPKDQENDDGFETEALLARSSPGDSMFERASRPTQSVQHALQTLVARALPGPSDSTSILTRTGSTNGKTDLEASSMAQDESNSDDGPGDKSSKERRGSGMSMGRISKGMSRSGSDLPVCLICLEPLRPEDFESGEAMSLECKCQGETTFRHRSCATKWVQVKGDLICDICRSPIGNLPPPPPQSDVPENSEENEESQGHWLSRFPGTTDVFDCIRMTWVVTIVCILFFELNITVALFIGMVVAVLYTLSCQIMRCMYNQATENQPTETTAAGNPVDAPNTVVIGAVV